MNRFRSAALAALALFCISVADGQLNNFPVDVAAVVGTSISLNCSANNLDGLSWQYNAMDPVPIRIVNECQVDPSLTDLYDVVDTELGQCDLIIKSSSMQSAGTYTCQNGFSQAKAVVIMLNSNSVCSYSPSVVTEGTVIRVLCVIYYNGSIAPKMSWSVNDTGLPISNATTTTFATQVNSYIDVPIYKPSSRPFQCMTYFDAPITFVYIWTLPTVYVHYALTQVRSHLSFRYYENVTLTCIADGYPVPDYVWTNVTSGSNYAKATIDLGTTGTHRFRCEASNTVVGVTTTGSSEVEVDLGAEHPDYCATTTTTTDKPLTTTTTDKSSVETASTTVAEVTTTAALNECGLGLSTAPPGSIDFPSEAWYPLCYVLRDRADMQEETELCQNRIIDLPPGYADYRALLNAGGNFGCYQTSQTDYSSAHLACFDNYQQQSAFVDCSGCEILYVCMRLP